MYFFGVVLLLTTLISLRGVGSFSNLRTHISNILQYLPDIQIVLEDNRKADLLDFFLVDDEKKPVFIGVQNFSENKIVISNFDNVSRTLSEFVSSQSATYINIIEDAVDKSLLEEISRIIWQQKRISKIFYLTKVGLFAYNPFESGGTLFSLEDQDYRKVFDNLYGFPVRVQMFRSVYAVPIFNETSGKILNVLGPDGQAAHVLEEKMNFTMILNEPSKGFFGYRLDNESFSGAIGEIITNQTDISLTGFFIKDYLTRDVEFTAAVYSDKLCCYVPKAPRVPYSLMPLYSVHYSLWAVFVISGFGIALIWLGLRFWNYRLSPKNLRLQRSEIIQIVASSWIVWLRIQLNQYPPFNSEKIFILSISLVSVIFGAIFESSLATIYMKPLYYKDITSLKELDEIGFEIQFKHVAIRDDLFSGSAYKTYQHLEKRLKLVENSTEPIIQTLARVGGFAGVTRESSLELDDIYFLETGKIFKVPECPKDYTIAYILPRNSPFAERINSLLLRMASRGLIHNWIQKIHFNLKIEELISEVIDWGESADFQPLELEQLQLAFYVLVIGLLLAAICFCFEQKAFTGCNLIKASATK